MVLLVVGLGAGPAAAGLTAPDGLTVVPENGSPGMLTLTATPYPAQYYDFSPGDVVWWQVGAHVRDREVGALSLRIESSGELVTMPNGIVIDARACGEPWADAEPEPVCSAGAARVLPPMPLVNVPGSSIPLGDIDPAHGRWLLFSIGLPTDAGPELQGRAGRFYVELTASGDTPAVPSLPSTGAPTRALASVGLAAVAAGLVLVSAVRRRGVGGRT